MLLFKPEYVDKIRKREKTQTRRPWRRCRVVVGTVHQCRTNFKKGVPPFAKVRITAVRQERLGAISEADARAEGHINVADYIDAFRRIYGHWTPNLMVWVIDFELEKGVPI